MGYDGPMSKQPRLRVAESAKKTVSVRVRLTREEGELLSHLVERHDPPTASAYLRDLLAVEFDRPRTRPST